MLIHAYRHSRLMSESESRVEMSVYSHEPADLVASRVLERPDTYRRWESEHALLMRTVSTQGRIARQVIALRTAAFGLVHRRALFEYIRERHITGAKRLRLFALFYGNRDYCNALLTEHGNYIRCSSSYLATQHLAEHLMHDAAFDEPLQLYEEWYREYFRAYCDTELAVTEEELRAVAPLAALRPLLKHRLTQAREAILAMPQAPDREWREVQIRKANGDTQRMRTVFFGD
jgi:hypothetical protein